MQVPRDRKRKESLGCTTAAEAALAIDGVLAGQIALATGSEFASGRPRRGGQVAGQESENDAKLAQELGQLLFFVAVFLQEYMGQLVFFGPT